MSRSVFFVIVVALATLAALPSLSQAGITPPPGFAVGEWYKLAFVTSGTTTANSGDIATYDAFVQEQAALNLVLAPYAANFRAVAYATYSPPPDNSGDAVFNTRGEQLNSTPDPRTPGHNFVDFPSTWFNTLSFDQYGLSSHPDGTKVWTGFRALGELGIVFDPVFALGSDFLPPIIPVMEP
jgi:hypothetical protein